ncbi:hypothetical protein EON65_49575 [archaeon]|nr:MAG: hypothetical protein EON65_49575 [archaeon]
MRDVPTLPSSITRANTLEPSCVCTSMPTVMRAYMLDMAENTAMAERAEESRPPPEHSSRCSW